jgi:hypothetical protein
MITIFRNACLVYPQREWPPDSMRTRTTERFCRKQLRVFAFSYTDGLLTRSLLNPHFYLEL